MAKASDIDYAEAKDHIIIRESGGLHFLRTHYAEQIFGSDGDPLP